MSFVEKKYLTLNWIEFQSNITVPILRNKFLEIKHAIRLQKRGRKGKSAVAQKS